MKGYLSIIISFLIFTSVNSQDTILLRKGMYNEKMDCILIKDDNYDYEDALSLLQSSGKKTYEDKGRILRSFDDYWVASFLSNESQDIFHANIEAKFSAIYFNGKKIDHCINSECNDPRNILLQGQKGTAYFDVPPGTHLLVAKISDFHLSKNFNPKLSDSNTFEALTYKNDSKTIYLSIFLSSLFFLLSLVSISMYILLRDKSFLFYSLFSFTSFFHFSRRLGQYYEAFDFINKYVPWYYVKVPIFLCFYIFYILFSLYIINSKTKYKAEFKLMNYVIWTMIILSLPEVYFVLSKQAAMSYSYYFSIRFLSNLTVLYFLFRLLKYRSDFFVKIVLIGGFAMAFADLLTSVTEGNQYNLIGYLCMITEVVAFTIGISYKIYTESKRRINAERDLGEKIETINSLSLTTSQLNANYLQAQMNPHFIFNALNSIKYHILKLENEKASYYLSQFAQLMRMVLDHSAMKSISLKKELEALGVYIELESLRLNDELQYTLNISDEVNPDMIKVPPLILQPFVENVFVHAFKNKSTQCKLQININEVDEEIVITILDNGSGITKESLSSQGHQSKALTITKDRLMEWGKLNRINSSVEINNKLNDYGSVSGLEVRIVV